MAAPRRPQDHPAGAAGRADRGRRAKPRPAEWIVELGIGAGRPPTQVHRGSCYMAGERHRPISRDEARSLLAAGTSTCTHCRPDRDLGIIGLAARDTAVRARAASPGTGYERAPANVWPGLDRRGGDREGRSPTGERLCRASAERSSLQDMDEARGHCPLHHHAQLNQTGPASVPGAAQVVSRASQARRSAGSWAFASAVRRRSSYGGVRCLRGRR
ncbi:DUF6233 domain-containing protein [Streptomyces sp. NPDC006706]|uniref:DUF6233 domain-containing protein n=1 Tax=Streptomyces sp. NPDC006706 TaxID=3364761 RepID=UPI0036895291